MIWRRLLLRSNQTVADLHCCLQLALAGTTIISIASGYMARISGFYHAGGTLFQADAGTVRWRILA